MLVQIAIQPHQRNSVRVLPSPKPPQVLHNDVKFSFLNWLKIKLEERKKNIETNIPKPVLNHSSFIYSRKKKQTKAYHTRQRGVKII